MRSTLTFLFSLLLTAVYAQGDYVPGRYTTLNGEEVEVYMNDKNWEKTPKSIKVKRDLSSNEITTLNVSDIKGFKLSTGDLYESHIVEVERSTKDLAEVILFARPAEIVKDTVFLRALVKGSVSLYHLQYSKGEEHYFIQKGNEIPVQLVYRIARVENGTSTGVTNVPVYKGMLTVKLSDCQEVSKKINGVGFKQSELRKIVEEYNLCTSGVKGEYYATEEKAKGNFSIIGGLTNYFIYVRDPWDSKNSMDETSVGYTLGAAYQITFPRNHGRYSLLAEAMYKPIHASFTHKEVHKSSSEVYTITSTKYDVDFASLNLIAKYRFGSSTIRPFLNLGLGNNFVLSNRSQQNRVVTIFSIDSVYENDLKNKRKFEESLMVGFGAEAKKISTEFRYEAGRGISEKGGLVNRTSSLSFRLGYLL